MFQIVPNGTGNYLNKWGWICPKLRPPVLSSDFIELLDEYLRFRHVVRNVYTFSFDPERIGRLVKELEVVLAPDLK